MKKSFNELEIFFELIDADYACKSFVAGDASILYLISPDTPSHSFIDHLPHISALFSLALFHAILYGKDNLHAHVLALVHDLAVDDHLVDADAVVLLVGRIGRGGDLDLAPLLVGRYDLAVGRELLELLEDALLLDAALAGDEGRLCLARVSEKRL